MGAFRDLEWFCHRRGVAATTAVRPKSDRIRLWIARAVSALATIAAINTFSPQVTFAQATCVYSQGIATVTMDGTPAELTVGSDGRILVDGHSCSETSSTEDVLVDASTTNTTTVKVVGSASTDSLTINENGPGGAFPTRITFSVSLGSSADDVSLLLTDQDNAVTAFAWTLDLNGGRVYFGGVEHVIVRGGSGDDRVDASVGGTDPGPFVIPLTVFGEGGNDTLTGGSMDDALYGQDQSDALNGGAGTADILIGGKDPDTCWFVDDYLPCDPTFELVPPAAPEQTTVVVNGAGWYPENGPVSITFGSATANSANIPVAADGTFTEQFHVPPAEGTPTVNVRGCQRCADALSNDWTTNFTYAPVEPERTLDITPDRGTDGQTIKVSGSGWLSGELVRIFIDPKDVAAETPVATRVAGTDGVFSTSFVVDGLSTGRHNVLACQRCGEDGAPIKAVPLSVSVGGPPVIRPTPSVASVGDRIRLSGFGWRPLLGDVTVTLNGAEYRSRRTVTPRPDGSFVLVLREMPGGSYRIVACQRCATPNRIEAEAAVSISPATGSPTWPALVAFALVAAAGLLLLRARLRRPRPKGPEKPATTPEISARLVQRAPRVSLTRVGDGSDHVIRLMPHERAAVVHVEEARQS